MENITKMESNKMGFTDLMVGDYIYHINEHIGGSSDLIISKIKEVHEHKIITEYDLISHEYEMEPIGLTPKMLDGFGFMLQHILKFINYKSNDIKIQF